MMTTLQGADCRNRSVSDMTQLVQQAIDQCTQNGGGTVRFEGGTFVVGTIYLKSNVTLEVDASAVLTASPDIHDYGTDTHYNRYRNETDLDRCWIYAEGQENIGVMGSGKLIGNASYFPNEESIYRPMMMRFLNCRKIHLERLELLEAAAWTTAFLDSEYIYVRDVVIRNTHNYNGDGLDFDNCRHVWVDGCSIEGTDDNLCLQSGSKTSEVSDIHISNCTFSSICAGIRIGLKSMGVIKNVVITNCIMKNIWREGIKAECTEGGIISNVIVNGIVMENVSRPIFVLLNNRFEPDGLGSSVALDEMPPIGKMEKLTFSNIHITDGLEMQKIHYRFQNDIMGSPEYGGIRIDAEDNHKIEDVTMENINYTAIGGVHYEIPLRQYPQVQDQLLHPEGCTVDNYYPDWSRVTHVDIRNVNNLYISNMKLMRVQKDIRPYVLISKTSVLKKEIFQLEGKYDEEYLDMKERII